MSAVWPGATASEMQGQVADRVEKKLQELPFVDKIETYSKPSFASISFVFKDSTPARDVPMLFLLLRKKMADLRADLPPEVIGPTINDEFGDIDSVLYTVTGDGATYAQLKQVAEALRKRLQPLPDVTKVDLYGDQGERIFVEFSHAKLATLGLSVQAILDSLAKQNALVPAGEFQTDAQRVPLRVSGAVQGVAAVEETPVMSGGQTFRLGDIATVTHGYEDPPSYLIRAQGQPALEVGVVMQKGGNILALGKALDKTLAEFEADVPRGIVIARVADQPKVVDAAVFEFTRSFLEALAIVLGVSFVSLGWRSGLVVATSVPLVLAIVFVAMTMLGLDLQRVTLGALIIALGLLVDDAIIATETIVVKLEQGWDRERAASFAWTSTAFPMLTGTLVTAVGFMPIGLANSATGEYAGGIFWVVGIALVASWFVAVLFTPFLGFKLLPNYSQARASPRRAGDLCDPLLSRVQAGAGVLRLAAAGRHRGRARHRGFWAQPIRQGAAAVLPALGAAGTVLRASARRGQRDRRDREGRGGGGEADRWRRRRLELHDLHRQEFAALLVGPSAGAAQRILRADRGRRQGRGGARADQGAHRGGGRQGGAEPGARPRRPFQLRAAGRLSRAVPRDRPRGRQGARDRRRKCAT